MEAIGPKYQKYFAGHAQEGTDKHYFKPSEEDAKAQMDKYTASLDAELEKNRKIIVKGIVKTESAGVSQDVSD